MYCTKVLKFFMTVVFLFTVSILAIEISKTESFDGDDMNLNEETIGKEMSKLTFRNQPKEERLDDINNYPKNLRFWFGKSREWSNFQHPKQLKRSGGSTSSSLPFSSINNDSSDTFTNNSLPKYHCPINLLHGNNLTVKNYFLVIPRSNDNFNDTLQRIASLGEENCEPKTIKTNEENISLKPAEVETPSSNHSLPKEPSSVQTTLHAAFDTTGKTEETSTKNIGDSAILSEHATVVLFNTTEAEATSVSSIKEEYSLSLFGEDDKSSTASMFGESTTPAVSSETQHSPAASTEVNEFLRTVDKYCETFNSHVSSTSPTLHAAMAQTALYNHFIPPVDQLQRLNRNPNSLIGKITEGIENKS